jgi:L-aspartate oxidase
VQTPAEVPSGALRGETARSPRPPELSAGSRRALWRYAGLTRNGDGLRTLAADDHPLVRLIAAAALTREESRGAHRRLDFPARDPAMEGRHITLAAGGAPSTEMWT